MCSRLVSSLLATAISLGGCGPSTLSRASANSFVTDSSLERLSDAVTGYANAAEVEKLEQVTATLRIAGVGRQQATYSFVVNGSQAVIEATENGGQLTVQIEVDTEAAMQHIIDGLIGELEKRGVHETE